MQQQLLNQLSRHQMQLKAYTFSSADKSIAGYPGTSYPDFNCFPSLDDIVTWQYTDNWKSLGVDGSTWTEKSGKVPAAKPVSKPVIGQPDQILHVGEYFKGRPAYRVDAMKNINGIWQVINFSLAGGKNINWTLNGLGVESVDKVDKNGKKTKGQTLNVGDYFRLHSDRIKVVDVDRNGIAFSTRYGNVWADAGTLTEVK